MERYTYHFQFNSSQTKALIESEKILPINYLPDSENKRIMLHDYAERARVLGLSKSDDDVIASEAYFKDAYDSVYKPILKKPYWGNYGIYTTPIPLFLLSDNVDSAISINIDNLDWNKCAIRFSKHKIFPLSDKNYDLYCKPYLDDFEMTKKIWNSNKKLKFVNLPEITIFEDSIPFTKNDILLRGEF